MKQIFLIILVIIFTGCSHSHIKNEKKELIKKDLKNEKVEQVPFKDPDIISSNLNLPNKTTCKEDQLLFLIKYPSENLIKFNIFYSKLMEINNIQGDLINSLLAYKQGKINQEDYNKSIEVLTQNMEDIANSQDNKLMQIKYLDSYTAMNYISCKNELRTVLSGDELDPDQNSCLLNQVEAYILDPFNIRETISDGIRIEVEINKKLAELQEILQKNSEGTIPSDVAQTLFNEKTIELEQSGLYSLSEKNHQTVQMMLSSTFNIKSDCIKEFKKNHKIKKNKKLKK